MPADTTSADDAAAPARSPAAPPRRRRWLRTTLVTLVVLALLGGGGAVAAWWYARDIGADIVRIEAFDQVPQEERPVREEVAANAMNLLILGSDTRDPGSTGGSRADTIILMHVPADRSGAQLVSIPRDTWIHVPSSADGRYGDTDAKINAAYAWGGAPLMVQTVENYTGVRIDHVVMVDFAGFKDIVDALDGVEIDVEEAFTSTHSLNPDSIRRFEAGPQTMDGAAALDYARERYAFADGDFARIRHQQQVIRAIIDKASSGGILTNPGRLNAFLRATADAVAVDDTLNIVGVATDLRHLRSGNLSFYTSPTSGTGMRGDQSVVLPDTARAEAFYDAVRRDDTAAIAATGTAAG
ncbi:LCP family protein [Solwaraspora sp. WMMA2101]|uniref:LCP family protein n=1 Tax=Solwaraspora sp. WMMA2101 TaxID=3404124 RepID=UPI00259AF5F4|nr:LCP family protein [Solwaraspora sp. WMMA2056]WJK39854.1 LCP family protein [Solwaraspora sp. WMMA2056]